MLSDEWLPRYRLLENFTAKWNGNGNGNAYDRGDYNSSFALRAVELKTTTCMSACFYAASDQHLGNVAVINLKFKHYSQTIVLFVQNMQTVETLQSDLSLGAV